MEPSARSCMNTVINVCSLTGLAVIQLARCCCVGHKREHHAYPAWVSGALIEPWTQPVAVQTSVRAVSWSAPMTQTRSSRSTWALMAKFWQILPSSTEQMRLEFARQRCDEPVCNRPSRQTICTGSLPRLLCTWRCKTLRFRVDARASPREQQYVPAVVSTVQTVEHPVLLTALPGESLVGEARLLYRCLHQVHSG